jgi:hypothetical protein
MPELTSRRFADARDEYRHVYYGDVHAGRAHAAGLETVVSRDLEFYQPIPAR